MDCVNTSDVDFLSDEINEMYYRLAKIHLFMGGIIIITTFTNMSMLCTVKNKLNEIKNNLNELRINFMPPNYK
jgi:hypothetical protein